MDNLRLASSIVGTALFFLIAFLAFFGHPTLPVICLMASVAGILQLLGEWKASDDEPREEE